MVSAPLLYICELRAAMRPLTPQCTRQRFPHTRNMHIIPPKEKSPAVASPAIRPRLRAPPHPVIRCLPVSNKRNCKSSHCAYAHATLAHTQHHLQALHPHSPQHPKISSQRKNLPSVASRRPPASPVRPPHPAIRPHLPPALRLSPVAAPPRSYPHFPKNSKISLRRAKQTPQPKRLRGLQALSCIQFVGRKGLLNEILLLICFESDEPERHFK